MSADGTLPSAPEAEAGFLGSVLLSPESLDKGRQLRLDSFIDEHNRALYYVFTDFRSKGKPFEPAALTIALKARHPFKGAADPTAAAAEFIDKLDRDTPTSAHAEYYARLISDAELKRRMVDAGKDIITWASNGRAPREILNDTLAGFEDLRRDVYRVDDGVQFTFAQLREKFPELKPPVIEGLIRQGETANFIANPKIGKSWGLYNLLLCKCAGLRWLGQFDMPPGRVLLIDNELHRETLSHRVPKVAAAMGLEPIDWQSHFDVWALRGRLPSLQELMPRFKAIEPGEYDIIGLDSKYRAGVPGVSENDNSAETQFYNTLDKIAEQTESAIVVIHHASKGSQTDKRVTDVGAGAGSQSRACDAHLILREHEEPGVVVLEAAVRSFKPVEPLALRWNFPLWVPASGIDASKLKGRATKREEQQSEKDREGVNQIIKALADGPATARNLSEKTGISRERQQRLLDWLMSEDQISAQTITVKGKDCREYSIQE